MPGEPIRLGPFVGGLNTASDPSAVADAELSECVNFELDIDGSLVSRPPIKEVANLGSWTERIVVLAVGQFTTGDYIIGSNSQGVYYFNSGVWTLITSTFQATCAVQYADKVWLIAKPGSANPGGNWDPSVGFTAVAAIPKGDACVIHKERLFIMPGVNSTSNRSRLTFSDAANFSSWPGTNFIDVNAGDGQALIDGLTYSNNLLLFKNDSTYYLSYATRPTDAELIPLSQSIGATQRRCVVKYENSVFVYHEGDVFEMVGFDFTKINVKVPLIYDGTAPSSRAEDVFLSIFGDRLLVRYFNRIYVYGLRTRTWSRWESASTDLHNFGPLIAAPSNVAANVNDIYYAGSAITSNTRVYQLTDGYDGTIVERTIAATFTITCYILTKNYDLAISHQFKRLFWWGADVVTNQDIIGIATPIVFGFQPTWGDLSGYTWGQLASNTWGQPLSGSAAVLTTVATGSGVNRRFAKFLKALRYRQINFKVQLTTNGSTSDGPCRLLTITAITTSKQKVPAAIN